MDGIRSGVMPSGLGISSTSAPNARIVAIFSSANASDDTIRNGYPLTAQTNARDEPVLPPVYSTTNWPGRRRPSASAASIIARAIRSLYEPVGLAASIFTHTSAQPSLARWASRTTGVSPIANSPPARPAVTRFRPCSEPAAGLVTVSPLMLSTLVRCRLSRLGPRSRQAGMRRLTTAAFAQRSGAAPVSGTEQRQRQIGECPAGAVPVTSAYGRVGHLLPVVARARDGRLARVPDRAGVAGGALVAPGFVGHAPQVMAGPPAEQEFGLGVVEPGGVVGRADADGRQATRFCEVGAELAVVDWLVHADVEGLPPGRGMVDRVQDRVGEIVDVHEVPLDRAALLIEHHRDGAAGGIVIGLLRADQVPPPRAAEDIVPERQLVFEVVFFHHPRRPQAAHIQVVLDPVLLDHHLLQHLRQCVAARVGAVRLGLGYRHRVRVEEMPHPGVPADEDELPERRAGPAGLQQPEQALDRDVDDGLGCLLAGRQVQDVRHAVYCPSGGRALIDRPE